MKYDGLFAIENCKTGEIIQSEYSRELAWKGVQTLNDHELKNGRAMIFQVIEITEEELNTLKWRGRVHII